MRLAELRGPGEFAIVDVPVPRPAPGEVLVEVVSCGVCASELGAWTGRSPAAYPVRFGHEVAGRVVECAADVVGVAVGDRVAVWTTAAGYAEYVTVRAEYCRPLPPGRPAAVGLVEPLACAVNAVERADVRLGDRVLILGAGYMGLLVTQLVARRGASRIIVADRRADVLAAAQRIGQAGPVAVDVIDIDADDLTARALELTGGDGADVTFEVTGAQSALDAIGDVTRMSGTVVLVGFHTGEPRRVPLMQWNWKAFTLVNAHFRDVEVIMRGMSVAMSLLATGQIDMASLVTHRFELADIGAAFDAAVAKPEGFIKAIVEVAKEENDD